MHTLLETPIFSSLWPKYWTEEEYGDFCAWLARNPYAGDVIKQTGGCRKVRWSLEGRGKRGGVRVIYLNQLGDGHIWLLFMYSKNVQADAERKLLTKLRETIDG
jgi:hypothetical protein